VGDCSEGIEASGGSSSRKAHHVGISPQEDRGGTKIAMGSTGYVLRCFSIRLRLPMVMGFDSAVDIISQITGTSSRIRNSVWQCSQVNLPASM
jgi:hypothetical protein